MGGGLSAGNAEFLVISWGRKGPLIPLFGEFPKIKQALRIFELH
jgi:hypothetical protein